MTRDVRLAIPGPGIAVRSGIGTLVAVLTARQLGVDRIIDEASPVEPRRQWAAELDFVATEQYCEAGRLLCCLRFSCWPLLCYVGLHVVPTALPPKFAEGFPPAATGESGSGGLVDQM